MEKETIYLSSAYLAPVEYYTKLLAYNRVYVEDCDHYLKQTYRNRCTIAAPDGPLALSVPIIKPDTLKCPMKDIRISDAYNHTPFFEYYKDDFLPFYEQKYEFLADFNEALCRLVCSLIGLEPQMERTTDYKTPPLPPVKTTSANASTPRRTSARKTPTSARNPITRYSRNGWVSCPT